MLLPASSLLLALLLAPLAQGDWGVLAFTLAACLVGFGLHPLLQHARRAAWCEYVGCSAEFRERLFTMFAPKGPSPCSLADEEGLANAAGARSGGDSSDRPEEGGSRSEAEALLSSPRLR